MLASGLLMRSLGMASRVANVPSSRMKVDGALHYASLADVATLIETGTLSPADVTRQMLDRIAAVGGSLHSYVTIMADAAMESARHAEIKIRAGQYRGPLHGMPVAVKDLYYARAAVRRSGRLYNFAPAIYLQTPHSRKMAGLFADCRFACVWC